MKSIRALFVVVTSLCGFCMTGCEEAEFADKRKLRFDTELNPVN